ncbi:MAG TPA: (d)CMP kinase [Nitrospiraceae bacterium]|nr:(d)CMP kinase [Nitrospiraceae bacterium]
MSIIHAQRTADTHGRTQRSSLVIAIDGPAGAGKSTVAKLLASRLGYLYLDTGALYRALAWKIERANVAADDAASVERLLATTVLDVRHQGGQGMRVSVDGQDVTDDLRAPDTSALASVISSLPAVREWLLPVQRRIAEQGAVVAEGRDVGTRVFPAADVKFFLEATPEVRAQRRFRELAASGRPVSLADTARDLVARDTRDRTRALAPLVPAPDALTIDTSNLDIEQVLQRMLAAVSAKL